MCMIDCNTEWDFPRINSAAANSRAVELDDLEFRRTNFPPGEVKTIYRWIWGLASQYTFDQ